MIYTSNSEGNEHLSSKRTSDRIIANVCHSLDHKFYSRTQWNIWAGFYFWNLFVLLFLWELMPQVPCLAYNLLETTNSSFLQSMNSEKRMWQVLSCHKCSTERHREQHHRQGQQNSEQRGHDEQHTGISGGFKKILLSRCDKAHRASGTRQEYRTRATFLKFMQPQFKDTELALDLFSIHEILSLPFKSRKTYQL